jgi:hypothetical protein
MTLGGSSALEVRKGKGQDRGRVVKRESGSTSSLKTLLWPHILGPTIIYENA